MSKNVPYPTQPDSYPPGTGYSNQYPAPKQKPPSKIILIISLVLFFSIILAGLIFWATRATNILIADQNPNTLLSNWEPITLVSQGDNVTSVAFSPDGVTFVAGNGNGTVRVWEVSSGKELLSFQGHKGAVNSVAFSPDGTTLAAGGENTSILWEVSSRKELFSFPNSKQTNSIAFSPDGKTLATGNSDGTIRLWDVSTGKKQVTFGDQSTFVFGTADPEVHLNNVSTIAFSPDGTTLASGSEQGAIKLWRLSRSKLQNILTEWPYGDFSDERYITSVAFSPDGKTIAAGVSSYGSRNIQLWDISSGKELASFYNGRISAVAFSPDGKTLAVGGENYTGIWDVNSRKELAYAKDPYGVSREQHYVYVHAVAFSPDGKILATGNSEGTIKLWKQLSHN